MTKTTKVVATSVSSSCCSSIVRGTMRTTREGCREECPHGNFEAATGETPGSSDEEVRPAGESAQMDGGPEYARPVEADPKEAIEAEVAE